MASVWMNPGLLAWIPAIVYFVSFIPQIITNYEKKSAEGMSQRMVYLLVLGGVAKFFYNIFLDLPLAYRCMRPLSVLASFIFVAQAFYYSKDGKLRFMMLLSYGAMGAVSVGIILLGSVYPELIGGITGWVSTITFALYPLPQMYKNYRRKSIEGLNFMFLTLVLVGNLLEMMVALLLRLPAQSMIHGLRGMAYYAIFCYQFVLYSGKDECVEKLC